MAEEFEWVKLELQVPESDPVLPPVPGGIVLTTLAELGDTVENRRKKYELNAECAADISDRGVFPTWEKYCELRLDVPSFDPAGVTLALDGDEWVGMSGLSNHPALGICFQEMTGVRAPYRRKGIATAMKLHTVRFARSVGASLICTVHNPKNTSMIALNRQLGWVDAYWDYPQS